MLEAQSALAFWLFWLSVISVEPLAKTREVGRAGYALAWLTVREIEQEKS